MAKGRKPVNNPAEREAEQAKRNLFSEVDEINNRLQNLEKSLVNISGALDQFRADFLNDSQWKKATEEMIESNSSQLDSIRSAFSELIETTGKEISGINEVVKKMQSPVANMETLKSENYQIIALDNGNPIAIDRPMSKKDASERAKAYHLPCVIMPVV